jgi:hypothetical protein
MDSGFAGRELDGCDSFVCSRRISFFGGLVAFGTAGLAVGAASESDWADLVVSEALESLSRSAASAPAIRICSSVGADLLPRDLGFVRAGVADSEEVCSGGGAACLGASGFVSRATITSCASVWATTIKLQSSTLKSPVGMNRRDKQLPPITKPLFTNSAEFSHLAA